MKTSALQGDLYKKNKKIIQKYNSKAQLNSSPSKLNLKVYMLIAN